MNEQYLSTIRTSVAKVAAFACRNTGQAREVPVQSNVVVYGPDTRVQALAKLVQAEQEAFEDVYGESLRCIREEYDAPITYGNPSGF